ncbi:MAG TPA: ATP-binding protein [Acidimicrobiales bacterium]
MAGDRFSAPELTSRSYDGMVRVAQRAQVFVGGVGLLALWLLQGVPSTRKVTVSLLLLCVYLPWTIFTPRMARIASRPVNMMVDLLAIGVFALVIPETRVAVMTAYVLMVGFHAYVSGRAAGLVVVGGVLAVMATAEVLAPRQQRLDAFTIVMYAAVLVAFTVMLDGLAAERRRVVRHLSRLNDALAALTSEPALDRTLDSVAESAKDAVDATFVVVLLRDGERMLPGSTLPDELAADATGGHLKAAFDAMVAAPETTPTGLAMTTGAVVAVADFATDTRFSQWADAARRSGFAGEVALPLGSPIAPLGALNAYFAGPHAFDEDDVALLTAYARQASLAVARALAFDRERDASSRLADADRMKSEFVARVSHELRTPLTAIGGFVSTVLLHWEQLTDAEKRELLGRANWNATELRRLVEQVLAFAQTGDADTSLMPVPIPLAHELDTVVANMLPVVGDHPVTIDVHPSVVVHADREALHHVLTNLLSNAAKFSPPGTEITVAARRVGDEVEVSVRDQGPGIAPHERERIFDRFYRSSAVSAKGTGIGLSIARSFVEQLGGRIWVEDDARAGADAEADAEAGERAGTGATFVFTLPRRDPEVGLASAGRSAEEG